MTLGDLGETAFGYYKSNPRDIWLQNYKKLNPEQRNIMGLMQKIILLKDKLLRKLSDRDREKIFEILNNIEEGIQKIADDGAEHREDLYLMAQYFMKTDDNTPRP